MRQEMQAVPRPVENQPGLVEVDTTWQGDAQSLETRSARVCELYDVIVLR